MVLGTIQKLKARTVFSFMIYSTWSVCVIIHMLSKGIVLIPTEVNMAFIAQLSFYFGGKTAKKYEVKV